MRARSRRRALVAGAVTTAALALAACSTSESTDEDTDAADAGITTVTFRLWDEVAVPAYQESFDAFNATHPGIYVEIEQVPWSAYWTRLSRDVPAGTMADIFWVDSASFSQLAEDGAILSVDEAIGDDHDEWQQPVVDLYTHDGELWGVPQLWDSVALYYNTAMVEEAGVDPDRLRWAPPSRTDADDGAGASDVAGGGDAATPGDAAGEAPPTDTLLPAAQALTRDSEGRSATEDGFDAGAVTQYGFNAEVDLQAVYGPFLAQNGAQLHDGDSFTFATPEGEEAFQYLVDMVGVHHVAPPAADTNAEGDASRELFVRGRLALFQSGPYSLRHIADDATFDWDLAPVVAGPEGPISLVHGVAAAANAHTENRDATLTVLEWLGSADGQAALASQGVAFPGAVGAQQTFVDYWAERGVDVGVFIEAAQGPTAAAPVGPGVRAGLVELAPVLEEMFLGTIPVPEALAEAQQVANTVRPD